VKKYGRRRFPFVFAVFTLAIASFAILLTRNLVEVFLFAELISVALFYIFFTVAIPATFPRKKDPEAIFIGGAGKPPYVSSRELLTPQLSLIPGWVEQETSGESGHGAMEVGMKKDPKGA